MQYENNLNILRQTLDNEEMHIIDKLSHIVAFIRPKNDDRSSSLQAIHQLIDFLIVKKNLQLISQTQSIYCLLSQKYQIILQV